MLEVLNAFLIRFALKDQSIHFHFKWLNGWLTVLLFLRQKLTVFFHFFDFFFQNFHLAQVSQCSLGQAVYVSFQNFIIIGEFFTSFNCCFFSLEDVFCWNRPIFFLVPILGLLSRVSFFWRFISSSTPWIIVSLCCSSSSSISYLCVESRFCSSSSTFISTVQVLRVAL